MIADGKLRLVIDPGHGGEDPGAVHAATGLREADAVLRIAHVFKAILDTHPEFEATLTREGDRTVALNELGEATVSSCARWGGRSGR